MGGSKKRIILIIAVMLCSVSIGLSVAGQIYVRVNSANNESLRELYYSKLIYDLNGDGVSDVNDIIFARYSFSDALVPAKHDNNTAVVFFRSDISEYMTSSHDSASGPYFDKEYVGGKFVILGENGFVNRCVKGIPQADAADECAYVIYMKDAVEVYSTDEVNYYYDRNDISNKLLIRRVCVEVYDTSTGELAAREVFDGDKKTLSQFKTDAVKAPNPSDINKFLSKAINNR